jgi:hypothetical protein
MANYCVFRHASHSEHFVSASPYYPIMVTFTDLDERVSVLEDNVFADLYPKVDAMNWGIGQVYQETQSNREEIAGLRVDVAALDATIHTEMTALKTAVILQVNEMRREILTTRSAMRTEMTAFKSAVERRFEVVDRRFDTVDKRFDALDKRFDAVDKRFDGLDAKLDEFLSQARGG